MTNFLLMCALSAAMIATTTLLTYEVMRVVWVLLPGLSIRPRLRVLAMMLPIFLCHIANIWLYALIYLFVETHTDFGTLGGIAAPAAFTVESFIERLYFSASTYASLGLGDIVPTHNLRMLATAEVLNGLLMIGWTISFTYLVMEKFWSLPHRKER